MSFYEIRTKIGNFESRQDKLLSLITTTLFMALNILVVDDTWIIRDNLRELLEEEGYYNVEEASSSEEAIEKIRENNYDIVFMDYQMDGINGLEETKRIREIKSSLPVYIHSLDCFREEQLNEFGATGNIRKFSTSFIDDIFNVIAKYENK